MKLAALIPVIAVVLAITVYCLVDLFRAERVRWIPKWGWAVVCLISMPFGGLICLALAKPPNAEPVRTNHG